MWKMIMWTAHKVEVLWKEYGMVKVTIKNYNHKASREQIGAMSIISER